jgi:hypothetical protein
MEMDICYKKEIESQDIIIYKLRPDKSYDYLIENRNASLANILSDKKQLEQYLKKRPCPVCDRDNYEYLYTKDSLDIVRCKSCSVVYVNPIFDEEKYIEIYKSKEYQKIG